MKWSHVVSRVCNADARLTLNNNFVMRSEEPFVDILFLTHDYYITSTQLLNHFIDLYERNKGKEEHMVDIRLRSLPLCHAMVGRQRGGLLTR